MAYDKIFDLDIGNPSFSEPPPYEGVIITLWPYGTRIYIEYEERDGSYADKEIDITGCYKEGVYYFDPTHNPPVFMKDGTGSWQLPPYKPLGIEFSSDEYSSTFPLETINLDGIDSTKGLTDTSNIDDTSSLFDTNFLSFETKYDKSTKGDTTNPIIDQEVTISVTYTSTSGGGGSSGGGPLQENN